MVEQGPIKFWSLGGAESLNTLAYMLPKDLFILIIASTSNLVTRL